MKHLDELAEEHAFYTQLMRRTSADQASNILMKQVCIVAFFCREHMELIHDLIANLRFKEVTEEELKDINEGK